MADELPPLFAGLNDVDAATALRRFETHEVPAGETVIHAGAQARGLICVIEGELDIRTGETNLGTATAGDLVGEVALFENSERTASVIARRPSKLMVLTREGYEELRDTMHPMVVAIERVAMKLQVERLGATGARIARLSIGTPLEPATPTELFFQALNSLWGGTELRPAPGSALTALRASPFFADAPDEVLERIAGFFAPHAAGAGTLLCAEGEVGDQMWVLEEGTIDVIIATRGDIPQRVAQLEPGAAFGMVSLAGHGTRMASCLAKTPVRVHQLDLFGWKALVEEPYFVGSTFRRAVVRAFSEQLSYSNEQLASYESIRRSQRDIRILQRAVAGVSAHGGLRS